MRIIIQRVSQASVVIDDKIEANINKGYVILLGIENEDTQEDIKWLTNKILNLRIFNDNNGVMNLSIQDIKGQIIVVSQFTLHASTKKGNRPSYIRASKPDFALPMYNDFIKYLKLSSLDIQSGIFGADMKINLINDGPVTIIIDSKNKE